MPFGPELGEHVPEFAARHGIDARRGLVEQQHRRTVDQRAAQREFLLHAARKLAGAASAEGFDLPVYRSDQIAVIRDPHAEERREKIQILADRKVGVEREATGHVAYAGTYAACIPSDVETVDRRRSRIGRQQRRYQAEQGGFSRTVRADQSEQLAAPHPERHAVESRQRPVAFGQPRNLNRTVGPFHTNRV